jgi:hypothetical protein
MGKFTLGWFLLAAGWASAILITALIVYSLPQMLDDAWDVMVGE